MELVGKKNSFKLFRTLDRNK